LHRRRKGDFDNCRIVTDNKGKHEVTQQDVLLENFSFLYVTVEVKMSQYRHCTIVMTCTVYAILARHLNSIKAFSDPLKD
jgi:hypothetical protein